MSFKIEESFIEIAATHYLTLRALMDTHPIIEDSKLNDQMEQLSTTYSEIDLKLEKAANDLTADGDISNIQGDLGIIIGEYEKIIKLKAEIVKMYNKTFENFIKEYQMKKDKKIEEIEKSILAENNNS
jgi:hypothetical protein